MTHEGRQRGFTLLELLTVLFLLGVVYALVGPALDAGSTGVDMRAATQQIAAGLRRARSTAVAQRRDTTLTLDVEGRRFTIDNDPRAYELPKKLDFALYAAQSEVVADKVASIRFYPDGSSTGGRVTISKGDTKGIVDVDWLTGRVELQ